MISVLSFLLAMLCICAVDIDDSFNLNWIIRLFPRAGFYVVGKIRIASFCSQHVVDLITSGEKNNIDSRVHCFCFFLSHEIHSKTPPLEQESPSYISAGLFYRIKIMDR